MSNAVNKRTILVLHGPNLNMLGTREPGIYGSQTLASIVDRLTALGEARGYAIESFQSNYEGALVDTIHELGSAVGGVIINPAAFTHYSIAIRDALAMLDVPIVEVHLSNVHAREEFRAHSVTAPVVSGQIAGFGAESYVLALHWLMDQLDETGP